MKDITLLLIGLFSCVVFLNGQEVFPTKNAQWEVLIPGHYYTPPLKGNEKGNKALIYNLGPDSIRGVNEKVYYNLHVNSFYAGSLRVDEKQVWITADSGRHETLLYDFGVKEGDTIVQRDVRRFHSLPFFQESYSISNELCLLWNFYSSWGDSIEIKILSTREGKYGKEIKVLTSFTDFFDTWCEGIGSLHGMLLSTQITTNGHVLFGGVLWKMIVNNTRFYPDVDYGNYEDRLTEGPLDLNPSSFSSCEDLYFEAASQSLYLLNGEEGVTYSMELYSSSGQPVYSTHLSSGVNSLPFSVWARGVYFCRLIRDHQIILTKKISL